MKTLLNVFMYLNLIGTGYNFGNMLHQCFEHQWLLAIVSTICMLLGITAAILCDIARKGMEVRK